MQIKEWMEQKNLNPAEMARILDVSYHVMYNILRGGEPSLYIASKIINVTRGEVSLMDLSRDSRAKSKA